MAADTTQAHVEGSNGNGRVTIAVLGKDIAYMREAIDKLTTKVEKHCDSHEVLEQRQTSTELNVVRLQEQHSTLAKWTAALGVVSPAAAGMLAWVAAKFGT